LTKEAVEMSEQMKIELGDALAALANGQVRLQRHIETADATIAKQAAKLAEQEAKLALQQRLMDSHEHRIAMLEMMLQPKGAKSDA
jgi:hypothetical protein